MATADKFNEIVKALHQQANIRISANDPKVEIINAFNGGESIDELSKFHPNYSAEHGRIYPLYDDEEGFFEKPEGSTRDELTESIAYAWNALNFPDQRFTSLAFNYESLCNSIADLASYHPDYNINHGTIGGE